MIISFEYKGTLLVGVLLYCYLSQQRDVSTFDIEQIYQLQVCTINLFMTSVVYKAAIIGQGHYNYI